MTVAFVQPCEESRPKRDPERRGRKACLKFGIKLASICMGSGVVFPGDKWSASRLEGIGLRGDDEMVAGCMEAQQRPH